MKSALVLVVVVLISACSTGPGQQQVVSNIVTESILQNLDEATDRFNQLSVAASAFCEAPREASLLAAQDAWIDAKRAWEPAQLTTYFDPGDMMRTLAKVDFWPASPEGIQDLLASDSVIDEDYVDNRSASTQRGLGALEYLLFRDLSEAGDPRACQLVTSAASVASAAVGTLRDSWTMSLDEGIPFLEEFTSEMTSRQALGDLVSAAIETFKRQTLFEIGKSLGATSPEPVPNSMEEGNAYAGVAVYRASLDGVRSWLNAGGSESLIELIRALSPRVAGDIETELERATAELEELGDGSLNQIAIEDPDRLMALYQSLDRLWRIFETDVVSTLDVTVGFSDSDGDSG